MTTALTVMLVAGLVTPVSASGHRNNDAGLAPGGLTPLTQFDDVELPSPAEVRADIVGGSPVRRGTHRWTALVLTLDEFGDISSVCTGTLIRQRWVVTAAHCLVGASGAGVVLGASRLDDIRPRHLTIATSGAIHPNYRPRLARNDVALLRLAERVRLRPMRLAGAQDDLKVTVGTHAKIVGWGAVDGSGTPSDELRVGKVDIWSSGSCRELFGTMWSRRRHLCAGAQTTDACFGDSGGPLLVRRGTQWLQHGITSFGDIDCLTGDASGYTRVSAVRPWIERVTGLRPRS